MPVELQVIVTKSFTGVPPAVMVPSGDTVQLYPVCPASVVKVLPVAPLQVDAGPVRTGTGKGFTVTEKVPGNAAKHPAVFWYVTITDCGPEVCHNTSMVLEWSEGAVMMVPPFETVH